MNTNLFLRHNTITPSKPYKNYKTLIRAILEDGFLRSSKETKNTTQTGDINDPQYDKNAGKTIYFEINLDVKQSQEIKLDISLLLEQPFWLNVGWQAGIQTNDNRINPKGMTINDLVILLNLFKIDIYNEIKKLKGWGKLKYKMSNEILVKNPVDLHKYLIEIDKRILNKDDLQYVKENYPNVKIK